MRLLAASLMLLAMAGTAGAATTPHLRIEATRPIVVSGVGFGPSERIVLRFSGGNMPRLLRTDAAGSFRVQLGSLRALRCAAFIVVASGAAGHTASAHLPRAACMTPHRDAPTN